MALATERPESLSTGLSVQPVSIAPSADEPNEPASPLAGTDPGLPSDVAAELSAGNDAPHEPRAHRNADLSRHVTGIRLSSSRIHPVSPTEMAFAGFPRKPSAQALHTGSPAAGKQKH